MSDFLVDQLYFEPSFLSEMVHSMPHMSFSLDSVNDVFDPSSTEYLTSLLLIGIMPIGITLCALLVLGIHVVQEMYSIKNEKILTKCHCAPQRFLRFATILLGIMIFIEIMVHLAVIRSLPLSILPETDSMRDFHMYQVRKVDSLCNQLEVSKLDFNDKYLPSFVEDMTDAYKEIATKVILAGIRVRERQLAPREMMMPFAQYLSLFEWFRFIGIMIVWFLALVICLMRGQTRDGTGRTSIKCGAYALIFSCVMSSLIMAIAVALADACQDPADAASKLTPRNIKKEFLQYQYSRMCLAYRTAIYESLREFRLSVLTARRQVLRQIEVNLMVFSIEANAFSTDKLWPDRERVSRGFSSFDIWSQIFRDTYKDRYDTYKHKRLYAQAIYKYVDTFHEKVENETWTDRLYCFDADDEIEEYGDFKDDARQLCQGDRVLIWLLMQFVVMMIIGVMFFKIIQIHISNKNWERRTD